MKTKNNTNFLEDFFDKLHTNKIRYCVLRNYERLPNSTNGSDLDMLINKSDESRVLVLLEEISAKYTGNIVSIIPSPICPRVCLLGSDNGGWGVMIDLHYDVISYRDYTILSNKVIWNNTFHFNNEIMALNLKSDALVGLFKELLNNEKCYKKYYDNFQKLALEENFINKVFLDIKKPALGDFLLGYKNKPFSKTVMQQLVARLNKDFPKRSFSFLKHADKLKRLFKQPGFTIAFLGTDGSGKSTIIEVITPALNEAFHNAVYYEHMRPNKYPSIAKLMGNKEDFNGPVSNPHGSRTSGFLGSFFRWSYYMLDYVFGFYLKIWPKKAIRSCVWIFDRYYYDYLIDPKRARIKLPKWTLKLGQFLIPEPDLILCLGTDAQVIHKRKPELTLEEVERQVTALKKFSESHKRAVWIDTGNNIETSTNDAMETIINMMGKRFESVNLSN